MAISRVEINFAIPVELTDAEMQVLYTIANDAAKRTETAEIVHWAAGCGDKPNWSKTDCAIFGYEPTKDSPETGEPTFDDSIFCIDTASRERYDTEPFDPTKRRTPIDDWLWAIRDPHKRTGIGLIREERIRQLMVEGWTPEHDDIHTECQLLDAAICYAGMAGSCVLDDDKGAEAKKGLLEGWPWDEEWWKPSDDPIRNLVKAGALIAAEIDRLKRKQRKEESK